MQSEYPIPRLLSCCLSTIGLENVAETGGDDPTVELAGHVVFTFPVTVAPDMIVVPQLL
jgi:hypothetical protein